MGWAEALTLWLTAAEAGDPTAAFNAAKLLDHNGDDVQAERWYRFVLASDGEDADGYKLLYRKDRQAEAVPLIVTGAAAGSAECAHLMAHLMLEYGDRGEAERWLRQAADGGRADALRNLGTLMYEADRTSEAVDAWVRAARQGDAGAAYNAAVWYDEIDERGTALGWYRRAAELGDRKAARELRQRTGANERDRSRPAQRRSRTRPR